MSNALCKVKIDSIDITQGLLNILEGMGVRNPYSYGGKNLNIDFDCWNYIAIDIKKDFSELSLNACKKAYGPTAVSIGECIIQVEKWFGNKNMFKVGMNPIMRYIPETKMFNIKDCNIGHDTASEMITFISGKLGY